MHANVWRRRSASPQQEQGDIVFVVSPENRGWILDGICHEVARRADMPATVHYGLRPLPKAASYFFSHHVLFSRCRDDPALRGATSLVLFTHPNYPSTEAGRVARCLRSATTVISLSSLHARTLIEAGLPRTKVQVVLPGADPERFLPHGRGSGAVGLCSAYYPRKSPERIIQLTRALPHRQFRLLGKGWREAPVFVDLQKLPNFSYLEAGYQAYPDFYSGIDVFVSPSKLEGGPIPLIEAMMANAVPVATRTGLAPDVIYDGVNGFLCDVDATAEIFAGRVEAAFGLDADVRSSVRHLTWDAFAARILASAGQGRRELRP